MSAGHDWTIEESFLLLDAFSKVERGNLTRSQAVKLVYDKLQSSANAGAGKSDSQRDINDIDYQFGTIQYLMSGGKKGIPRQTALAEEAVRIYMENPENTPVAAGQVSNSDEFQPNEIRDTPDVINGRINTIKQMRTDPMSGDHHEEKFDVGFRPSPTIASEESNVQKEHTESSEQKPDGNAGKASALAASSHSSETGDDNPKYPNTAHGFASWMRRLGVPSGQSRRHRTAVFVIDSLAEKLAGKRLYGLDDIEEIELLVEELRNSPLSYEHFKGDRLSFDDALDIYTKFVHTGADLNSEKKRLTTSRLVVQDDSPVIENGISIQNEGNSHSEERFENNADGFLRWMLNKGLSKGIATGYSIAIYEIETLCDVEWDKHTRFYERDDSALLLEELSRATKMLKSVRTRTQKQNFQLSALGKYTSFVLDTMR